MTGRGLMDRLGTTTPARKHFLAAGLIFVLALAAYSNSFNADFHFDDTHQILENRNVRALDNLPRFFVDASLASSHHGLKGFRPITLSSLTINHALSGYGVFGYHVVNFLLHVFCAFFVYLVVRSVLAASGERDDFLPALSAALIFALHPIQTGAVTYISGRSTLLAAMFYLMAFYAFVSYRKGGGPRAYAYAILAPLLFLAGLLSKETAASLLAVFVAYDVIFTLPGRGPSGRTFRTWLYYVPFLAVFAAYFFYRKALVGFAAGGQSDHMPGEYLLSEAKAVLLYLRLMVLPVNQNADYNLPSTGSMDGFVVLSAALGMAALFLIYGHRKKDKAAAFFGLWFIIALLPESSVIPIEDIAVEYRLYLPSAGLIALAVIVSAGCLKKKTLRRGILAAVLVLLGVLTFNRNFVWATDYTLWKDAVNKAPQSFRAHANYGAALLNRGQYGRAVDELLQSLEAKVFYNESFVVYNNLGLCYEALGMPEKAEAAYKLAIDLYPQTAGAHRNLGGIYYGQGRYGEAVGVLRQAVMSDPQDWQAHFLLAKAYTRTGKLKEAVPEMEQARRLKPGDFYVRYDLAVIYMQNGMREKALEQARASLPLAPDAPLKRRAEVFVEGIEKGLPYPGQSPK